MGNYQNSILIGVKIEDINKVKSNLQKQLDGIKGINAKIDTAQLDVSKIQSSIQTQLNGMNFTIKMGKVDVSGIDNVINKTKQATKEAEQFKNVMGKSLNIGDGAKAFDDLQRRANEIRNTVDSMAKISFNTTKNGGVKDASITYTDNMGKLVTETMKWKQVMSEADGVVKNVFTTTNVKVSENVQQLGKLEAKVESIKTKMQSKLSTANGMGIDPALITQLQTQLNNISVSTPISKINQLQQQINALGGNSSANINKLQNVINSLSTRINNIKATKMDIVNSNDIGELQKAEAHLLNLKQLLTQVKAGKIIDGKLISSEVSTARNSVNQLSSAINNVKANASSLGTIFKSVFSYAIGGGVIFAGLNQLRQGLKDIKNIDDSLRDLKRVSGDVADTTLNNFVGKANEMGISLGRTTEDALTATATFKQLGYTFKEASEYMASNSLILSNVGDMSASDSASSLVSILKGFKLEAKDTTKVVDLLNESGNRFAITTKDLTEGLRIGGASLALANNDLAQSTALIVSGTEILRDSNMVSNGLKTISMRIRGVADESGEVVPKMREDLQAMAGVDIKDVNGGFKSTFEIIKSLGERWNSKDNPLSDMAKANIAEQVAGKNRANVFASLMQNYQQLDKVYQMVGQSAGSAQKEQEAYINSISGKLNTFKETVKATWINVTDTNGIKSLITGASDVVGGLNNIIKTFGAMPTVIMSVVGAMTIFNTKFRESMTIYQPSFLTNLTGGLNNLKATWAGVAQTATENIRTTKQNITYMNQMGMNANSTKVQLAGYQVQLGLANIAQKACAVSAIALQMAFSMGLSLAISLAISKVMDLVNAQENLKKSNEEVISSYKAEKESVTSANNLLKEKKSLEDQINSTNEGTKENKDLKEKLLEVERQLATALPNSTTQYDEQGKAIATNNKQIEEQIKLKKQAMLNDTLKQLDDNNSGMSSISWSPKDFIGKGTNMGYGATTLESIDATIEKYKQLKEEAKKASEEATTSFGKNNALEDLQRYSKMLDEAVSKNSQYKMLIMNAMDAGKSTSELAERFGVSEDAIKRYSKAIEDNTDTQKQNSNESGKVADKTKIVATAMKQLNSSADISKESLQALQEAYPSMGISAENCKDSVQKLNDEISKNKADEHAKDIQTATDSYAKATQEIAKCTGFIDRLNKSQAMTPALASAISRSYPEIGDNINEVATAQEFLNQKIQDEVTQQASAYEVMMGDSQEFFQNKIANNQEYQNAYENLLGAFVEDGKKADDIDFENYRTLNELKQGTQHQFGVAIENWLTQFVGESAKGYATDFENFRSTAEQKASVLDKLNQEIKKINSNLAGAEALKDSIADRHKFDFLGTSDPRVKSLDDDVLQQVDSNVDKWKAKANELNGAIQEVDTKFNEFGASMKGFSGGGIGGTSDFSGTSGGGSGKADKSADEAEKWADKINELNSNIKTDMYYNANNAITQLYNTMTALKTSEEGLTGTDLANVKQKETDVINQQIEAYKRLQSLQEIEKGNIEHTLSQYDILVDSKGQLINAQEKLNDAQTKANALSGSSEPEFEVKQKALQQVKDLNDLIIRHTELVNSEIPKSIDTWNQYANAIKKANQETLKNTRDELVGYYLEQQEAKVEKLKKKAEEAEERAKKALELEKKNTLDSYDAQIKAKQSLIDSLDDDTTDNQAKLNGLIKDRDNWLKDNSSYSESHVNTLNKEIADLQKTMQKNSIQKDIDSLTEQKQISNDSYDNQLKDLEESNKKQEEANEKKYKKMTDSKRAYHKIDKMITNDNEKVMVKLYESYGDNYKEIGSLYGENVTNAFKEKLKGMKEALEEATKDLKIKAGGSGKLSGGSDDDTTTTNDNGTTTTTHSDGTKSYSNGDYTDSNGYYHSVNVQTKYYDEASKSYKEFATGTDNAPSGDAIVAEDGFEILIGKQAKKLKGGETILNNSTSKNLIDALGTDNSKEILKIDEMYKYMTTSGALIGQLSQTYSNAGRYTMPSYGMDLNKIMNSVTNTNNNNTTGDTYELNLDFNIKTQSSADAKSLPQDIVKIIKTEVRNLKHNNINR